MAHEPSPLSNPPFLLRGVARVIDLGVHLIVLELAFRCSAFMPTPALIQLNDGALFYVDVVVGLGAMVLTSALAEWLGGATLGKVAFALQVVHADHPEQPITLRAAVIRNLGFFVDSLFFGLVAHGAMARSPQRQRVGDMWANTVVVRRADAPARNMARGVITGVLGGFSLIVASYLLVS